MRSATTSVTALQTIDALTTVVAAVAAFVAMLIGAHTVREARRDHRYERLVTVATLVEEAFYYAREDGWALRCGLLKAALVDLDLPNCLTLAETTVQGEVRDRVPGARKEVREEIAKLGRPGRLRRWLLE